MKNNIIQNSIIQNFSDCVVFEGITVVSALISALDSGTAKRKILKVLFDETRIEKKRRELSFLKYKSEEHKFELEIVKKSAIDELSNGSTHGGILAICSDSAFPYLNANFIKRDGVYYMFEGVEDPYNFGYVIRSVYAAGADGIVMSPRNWLSAAAVVVKSSAGTSELIDMFVCEPEDAVDIFKSKGYQIVCAGIRDSVSVYDAELKKPLFVVVGGEKRGISRSVLEKADKVIRIDYGRTFKGSLPSVAATSIISFEILRKNTNIN